ncbi:hypothetical protein BCR34DRAFT_241365 [Clohesyomyces aquaticus]|uniref:Uncharacterized protein n=1 Tax=Clohesyomyces aquaticus TaxID=1231657 RepID=A0A1Y1ZVA8_9PLEO|nr:hypothetical protein BCR34DRAFT_241365 [Clohesyomyces aquaticus]
MPSSSDNGRRRWQQQGSQRCTGGPVGVDSYIWRPLSGHRSSRQSPAIIGTSSAILLNPCCLAAISSQQRIVESSMRRTTPRAEGLSMSAVVHSRFLWRLASPWYVLYHTATAFWAQQDSHKIPTRFPQDSHNIATTFPSARRLAMPQEPRKSAPTSYCRDEHAL